MVIAIVVLAWLGLAFGSFVNALVWRLHEQEKAKRSKSRTNRKLSIVTGRSQCPGCGHTLSSWDLVPVFSWLLLRGHCRYCKKTIPWQYPIVELALAGVFVLSYAFWHNGVSGEGELLLFITWLGVSVGLLSLLVYDARWQLLPNKIIYPTLLIAIVGRLAYIFGYSQNKTHSLLMLILAVAVSSGIFWLIFIISRGKWIGFGDVRLGLITGTVLAHPSKSFLMIFLASVLGTLFVLPDLIKGNKKLSVKIPFGPFLITSTWIVLLFGQSILDWYGNLIGLK
jgi:prepilin signal peptidase PulO-like enzyme (type II secretory pathway)